MRSLRAEPRLSVVALSSFLLSPLSPGSGIRPIPYAEQGRRGDHHWSAPPTTSSKAISRTFAMSHLSSSLGLAQVLTQKEGQDALQVQFSQADHLHAAALHLGEKDLTRFTERALDRDQEMVRLTELQVQRIVQVQDRPLIGVHHRTRLDTRGGAAYACCSLEG